MKISSKLTKEIQEVKYLATENSWRYRPLMRYCYLQYEQLKYWLYKEDIWQELRNHTEFSEYTSEECQQDLDNLVNWGNLLAIQDTAKAKTVEEFKTKQFRYQLSEYSVEIERMTIALENLTVEGASLEPSLIERIRELLGDFPTLIAQELAAVGSWWHSLNTSFITLNRNYQDYIRSFHSLQAEELMKSTAFIAYKDSIVSYLREFIKSLQNNSYWIEETLQSFNETTIEKVLKKVIAYELSIPRLEVLKEKDIRENVLGKWKSINNWFLGEQGRTSEVVKLFDITNELIRKITRYAAQIIETLNSAANRKEEYKKMAELFLSCQETDECHRLSSLVFGVFNSRHFKGNLERTSDDINSSVFSEPPLTLEIRPRVRSYRESMVKRPIIDKSKEKEKLYLELIDNLRVEQDMIDSLINGNQIDFASLGIVPTQVRTTLLRWVSRACTRQDRQSKTEEGKIFRLVDPPGGKRCTLSSEDGDLEMPAYKILFVKEDNHERI